jgi:Ulp1 family protease
MQENGSDCGLFMLEFMLRAFHDFSTLTDFLGSDEHGESETLFSSELILKRREQYRGLIQDVSEAKED